MEIEALRKIFAEGLLEAREERGQGNVVVLPEILLQVLKFCKKDPRFKMNMLLDVVGIDYLNEKPRFGVVYILYSLELKKRLLVKVRVEEGVALPSSIGLWKSADWAEREVWDMFGISFLGHPNLKRILMYEGFEGHPLRKDYPVNQRQQIPEIEEIP